VNIGLFTGAARSLYTQPHLRNDAKVLGSTAIGAIVLLSAEGALANAYAKTEAGRKEASRAKLEGALLYRHAEEIVLRPGVLGGLLGAGPFPLVLPLKTLLTRTQ
jgi:hypothetical protein